MELLPHCVKTLATISNNNMLQFTQSYTLPCLCFFFMEMAHRPNCSCSQRQPERHFVAESGGVGLRDGQPCLSSTPGVKRNLCRCEIYDVCEIYDPNPIYDPKLNPNPIYPLRNTWRMRR